MHGKTPHACRRRVRDSAPYSKRNRVKASRERTETLSLWRRFDHCHDVADFLSVRVLSRKVQEELWEDFLELVGGSEEITAEISPGASITRHLRAGARGTHMLRLYFAKSLLDGEVTGPFHRLRDENPHPAWARQASSHHVQSSDALLSCTYTASYDKSRRQSMAGRVALLVELEGAGKVENERERASERKRRLPDGHLCLELERVAPKGNVPVLLLAVTFKQRQHSGLPEALLIRPHPPSASLSLHSPPTSPYPAIIN